VIPVTSVLSALSSITLSVSLALGSTVALAAPPGDAPPPETPAEGPDTGATEAEKDEAEALSGQAIEKFQDKDFEGAVALFEKAYSIDPQPNFLFNIGRVYEEAGNFEKAVEYYAKFVKQPGVDLDSRTVALERLKALREILEATAEKQPDEKQPDETEPEEKQPDETEPVPPPPEPVDQDAQRKRKALRGAGFGVLGVGAAVLIGGAVAGGLAQGDSNKAEEAADPSAGQDLLASSQTKALAADVMYGIGGALLLTGVILVAVGYSKPKTQRVALTPSFGPRGAGVDLRLRF
jgi:tetratricopeptide (TPR) repeat protein